MDSPLEPFCYILALKCSGTALLEKNAEIT